MLHFESIERSDAASVAKKRSSSDPLLDRRSQQGKLKMK